MANEFVVPFYDGKIEINDEEFTENTILRFRQLLSCVQSYFDVNFEGYFQLLIEKCNITTGYNWDEPNLLRFTVVLKMPYNIDSWIDIDYEELISKIKNIDKNYRFMEQKNNRSFLKHEVSYTITLKKK